jgi:hypothetical protein
MKRIIFINVLFLLFAGTLFCAEDTTKTSDSTIMHRSKRPFFVFVGMDGLGIGGTIFGYVDVQAGSYIWVNTEKYWMIIRLFGLSVLNSQDGSGVPAYVGHITPSRLEPRILLIFAVAK